MFAFWDVRSVLEHQFEDTLPTQTQSIAFVPANHLLRGWIDKFNDTVIGNSHHAVVNGIDDDIRFTLGGG